MSRITNKVVLITGASIGIGEATARHLASQGARVVLGARRTYRQGLLSQLRQPALEKPPRRFCWVRL